MGPHKNQLGKFGPVHAARAGKPSAGPADDGQLLNLAALPSQPWENGDGVVTDIASGAGETALDNVRWRVSRMVMRSDGTFSVFPGVSRWIALMDGRGCRLDFSDGTTLDLVRHRVFWFSGDLAAQCRLKDGIPCTAILVQAKQDVVMRVNVARSGNPVPSLGHAVISASGVAVRLDGSYVLTADADQ